MKAVLPVGRSGSVGILLAAVTFAVSVACTSSSDGDGDGGESASSCAFLVDYENRTYSDVANVDFTVEDKLGPATLPPCDDTPNDDDDGRATPTSTTAYAVEGLNPSIAIAVGEEPGDARFVAVYSGNEIPPEVRKLVHGS
ncbi:DUF6281 family protein [Streptomyces ureilyticus]|uniref:DUF6281 family protein n=1 Tax=Streptomyces ureilyticus TaxID=1775131 RepID=UPI0019D0E69B|nr:DUF6281 family protein [Streptomyces ureilyticus]